MRSVALVIGGGGSVALTLYVGRENSSVVLMTLFVFWVLSPFVGLAVADALSKRWSVSARAALRAVTLVIAAGSLAIYGTRALGLSGRQGAFVFVVVPPASWLLAVIVVSIAALRSRDEAEPVDAGE